MDRNDAILRIKTALKLRSGKTWSVTGGRGTSWGWIRIGAPPKRCTEYNYMTEADQAELAALLGKEHVGIQGESVPASFEYRREYVARAEGRQPESFGESYWD
jgi:hypothetical protein